MGRGGDSERCLKWGGGRWGVVEEFLPKLVKMKGWVKAETVRRES